MLKLETLGDPRNVVLDGRRRESDAAFA